MTRLTEDEKRLRDRIWELTEDLLCNVEVPTYLRHYLRDTIRTTIEKWMRDNG